MPGEGLLLLDNARVIGWPSYPHGSGLSKLFAARVIGSLGDGTATDVRDLAFARLGCRALRIRWHLLKREVELEHALQLFTVTPNEIDDVDE